MAEKQRDGDYYSTTSTTSRSSRNTDILRGRGRMISSQAECEVDHFYDDMEASVARSQQQSEASSSSSNFATRRFDIVSGGNSSSSSRPSSLRITGLASSKAEEDDRSNKNCRVSTTANNVTDPSTADDDVAHYGTVAEEDDNDNEEEATILSRISQATDVMNNLSSDLQYGFDDDDDDNFLVIGSSAAELTTVSLQTDVEEEKEEIHGPLSYHAKAAATAHANNKSRQSRRQGPVSQSSPKQVNHAKTDKEEPWFLNTRILVCLGMVLLLVCIGMLAGFLYVLIQEHIDNNKHTTTTTWTSNGDDGGSSISPTPSVPDSVRIEEDPDPNPPVAPEYLDPILASQLEDHQAQPSQTPTAMPSLGPTCEVSYPEPPPLPGKKGIGMTMYPEGQDGSWIENLPKLVQLRPHWNYNWQLERIDAQPDDIEFVPTAVSHNDTLLSSFSAALLEQVVPHIVSGQAKRILGFVDPDEKNVSVSQAQQFWTVLEKMNLPLVSPSTSSQPDGSQAWLDRFMANATASCQRVDWVAIQYYGGVDFVSFVNRMRDLYDRYRRPLLITEFAVVDTKATSVFGSRISNVQVLAFMKQALPWLESRDWIAGYAWSVFKASDSNGYPSALWDEFGELTPCGRYYASVRNDNPVGDQTIQL